MNWLAEAIVPAVRTEGLVIEHLAGETLIYDLERDQVHQLNPTAAVVFELCDGRTSVATLADRASPRLERRLTAEAVGEALDQLAAQELLDLPTGVSRREVVRGAAVVGAGAAAAAPLIKSIVAPTPARAQSPECGQPGANCLSADDCCPNLDCDSVRDTCCIQEGDPCTRDSQGQDQCCDPSLSCEPEGPGGSLICVD
jgi:hypothetical protein